MKRYVQEKTETRPDGEQLQRIIAYEDKQKPTHFSYIVFAEK